MDHTWILATFTMGLGISTSSEDAATNMNIVQKFEAKA